MSNASFGGITKLLQNDMIDMSHLKSNENEIPSIFESKTPPPNVAMPWYTIQGRP